jgi:hypothetical protein
MRVLVVAEGRHERSGALAAFVARLKHPRELTLATDRVSRHDIHAFHGGGQGFFKRALRWLLEAGKRDYDALVLVIDEDGRPERSTQIEAAQEHDEISSLPRALGVAVRTFDAWMLADENALTQVLGRPTDRQPDPETIREPKTVCATLLAGSRHEMAQRAMYAALAKAANLETVEERCPRGFRPFAQRVRAM